MAKKTKNKTQVKQKLVVVWVVNFHSRVSLLCFRRRQSPNRCLLNNISPVGGAPSPAVGGVGDVGRWCSACLPQAAHCSHCDHVTFRVLQTVGVNAAQTTDATKFPRFTFGCVPRRQERKEKR